MNFKSKQKGLSPLGVLAVFIIVGFVSMLVMTLGPHYLDFHSVKSIVAKAAAVKDAEAVTEEEIIILIEKGLAVNSLGKFNYHENIFIDLEIKEIEIKYEVRESIMGNIDVFLSFNHIETLK